MASLWRDSRTKYWVACFTDRTGRRLKRSTRETDRRKAQKLADEYETAARVRRTSKQVRKVISELHQAITGEELANTTIRTFVKDWLARKKPETAAATYDFYQGGTRRFLESFGEADPLPSEITREHLVRYRNGLAKSIGPSTVNGHVKLLRMLFKAARREGLVTEDPAEFLDRVRNREESLRRPFTLPELRAVLTVADDEWRSLILFGLYCGQRLGDLARLTWANVDLVRGELRLTTGKTGRRVTVPLAEPLRALLEASPAGDDPHAFIHPRAAELAGVAGRVATLSNQFRDILAAAGLVKKQAHRRKADGEGRSARRQQTELSFHGLRRTATTLLHEAGIPAAVAQEFIGHDSAEVHAQYVTVGRAALETAAKALPDITR